KIVIAGHATTVSGKKNHESYQAVFALARFNKDGTLDVTFGNQGEVTTSFSVGTEGAMGVVVRSDGKIVAAGCSSSGNVFELARYNANGSLDTTFGTGGEVVTQISGFAQSVAIDTNGRIVVTGGGGLARFNPD